MTQQVLRNLGLINPEIQVRWNFNHGISSDRYGSATVRVTPPA
jgi:hypothetical protein